MSQCMRFDPGFVILDSVCILCLFLTMLWDGLQSVIVGFPIHILTYFCV